MGCHQNEEGASLSQRHAQITAYSSSFLQLSCLVDRKCNVRAGPGVSQFYISVKTSNSFTWSDIVRIWSVDKGQKDKIMQLQEGGKSTYGHDREY